MGDTSAVATNFGWDFQRNAGIILLLDNISELSSIRMEGKSEDIEITLQNEKKIYAQAKSVVKVDDYRNVKANCKKAISTLNQASKHNDYEELIVITNSPNPLGNIKDMSQFYGKTKLEYGDLSEKNKDIVNDFFVKEKASFEKEKFFIQVFPFHTDNEKERYKVVLEAIEVYLSSLHSALRVHGNSIMTVWQNEIFKNGTKNDFKIEVTKRQLHIPIVVEELNCGSIEEIGENLDLGLDIAEIEEITLKYGDIINNKIEDYEFFVKVIAEYKEFKEQNKAINSINCVIEFSNREWRNFKSFFEIDDFSENLQECLTRIVLYKITKNRIRISNILDGGGLNFG